MQESERQQLVEALVTASRALVGVAVRAVGAGPAEVTVVQHRVLVLLFERTTLSVNAIAEHLGVDQSNASRHCARLENLGLVSRRRAERDGRAVDVALTDAGRRQVQAVREARHHEVAAILSLMPDEQARAAVGALQHFNEAARTNEAAHSPPHEPPPWLAEPDPDPDRKGRG